MNKSQARKILGIDGTEDKREIKRKYRKLMQEHHPDNADLDDGKMAAKINTAYELIMKGYADSASGQGDRFSQSTKSNHDTTKRTSRPKHKPWSAKENKNAFCARPILHEVEDFEGNNLGTIEIARGKYIWTKDEEFSMFLKSLYETSKELLDNARPSLFFELPEIIKQKYLADIMYLLTGQFIDSTLTLNELALVDADSYKVNAMVELESGVTPPKAGSVLYPAGVSNHRLYLRNKVGAIVGYLSFKDDRLYYVVIPLFEQKKAQVKMIVADSVQRNRRGNKYADIDLWIRVLPTETSEIESTNNQIRDLLEKYAHEGF